MQLLIIVILIFSFTGHAQQTVRVNDVSFKSSLEVVTAQISQETIMLELYEIDKTDMKYLSDNCDDCEDGKSFILDVDLKRGFKFPIEAKDSVFIRVSHFQEGLNEYHQNMNQVNVLERARNKSEERNLKSHSDIIKEKGIKIAKLLQEGKITPEEAERQLMALTQSFNSKLESSSIAQTSTTEYHQQSNYAFNFYNDQTLTTLEPFNGYLYIKTFNQERFVAEYRGQTIENCVEKRAASSKSEEALCKAKESQLLPDTRVFNEVQGFAIIDVKIKSFLNNRNN